MEIYGLFKIVLYIITFGVCVIYMIKKYQICRDNRKLKNKGNIITILLLFFYGISLVGMVITYNYPKNTSNFVGSNIINAICLTIQFTTYSKLKKQ